MKQMVRRTVKELELYSETLVTELIADLSEVLEEHDGVLTFAVRDDPYCEGEYYLAIYLSRDETDEEYNDRMLEEERDKERIEEEEKKRRLQRFKLYQELKEEFESETS